MNVDQRIKHHIGQIQIELIAANFRLEEANTKIEELAARLAKHEPPVPQEENKVEKT